MLRKIDEITKEVKGLTATTDNTTVANTSAQFTPPVIITDDPLTKSVTDATKDYPGVTGNITIDEKHNATKPAVVLEIKDQKLVYKATIADPDQPMKN